MKVRPSKLHTLDCFIHRKSSDGMTYESDIYEAGEELYIELQPTDHREDIIQFNKPVTMIEISTNITNNITIMTFTLDDTVINIRSSYVDYYYLLIYRKGLKHKKHKKHKKYDTVK